MPVALRRRPAAVVAALAALLLVGATAPAPAAAVIGGRPADPGEWPWQVALLLGGQQFCGGTLVSTTQVLTAAHCTDSFTAEQITVLAGTVDLASGGQRRAVSTILQHEQYDDFNLRFDIAVLELAEPFELSESIGLVRLATDAESAALGAEGDPVVVTGFGATTPDRTGVGSRVLLEGDVQAIDDTRCLDLYREQAIAVYAEMQICAVGGDGAVDACYGDSGGPLMAALEGGGWVQVGVASWNARCGYLGLPTVYTEVPGFTDWLVEHGVALATGTEFQGGGTRIPARGSEGKAARYPLALDVEGFAGPLQSVAVRLEGFRHSRASDLDIWLVAPDGTTVTLLSDAGGDERFEDIELLLLPAAAPGEPGSPVGLVVGPTDHEEDAQWRGERPGADLGLLAGIDPNGRWELLIADDTRGAVGRLGSWVLVLR